MKICFEFDFVGTLLNIWSGAAISIVIMYTINIYFSIMDEARRVAREGFRQSLDEQIIR